MKKKSLRVFFTIFCIAFIVLSAFVTAQNRIKIEVPETITPGEGLQVTVLLYDPQDNQVKDNVDIIIEDPEKIMKVEQTIESGKPFNINLGENPRAGMWTITAKNKDDELKDFFNVKEKEDLDIQLQKDKLTIKNIGNARFTEDIDILIGDSSGRKRIDLEVGEETSFRLIAPDGVYRIIVTAGDIRKEWGNVALTGNVIGVLDEKLTSGGSPVTGGLKPEGEASDESFYSSIKNKKFVYIFLLAVIGAAILLAIERNYRRKA